MKILVTGANGFLGRECVRQLRGAGHSVVTTDRRGEIDRVGDLADAAFAAELPAVDVVMHCAAVQYVSVDLPLVFRQAWFDGHNVQATRHLCQRYAREPQTHFVNVGTSMMYAQTGLPEYTPSSPMAGQGVYSRSKLAAFAHVNRLPNPHATVIPCIIGGVGREGLFRNFVTMMRDRGRVVIPGNGEHKTHMVHVIDAARLLVRIVEVRATGLFNAAGPDPLTLNEWVEEIRVELGLPKVRIVRLPLAPIRFVSALSGYRVLAREQLLMLGQPHVLGIEESVGIGWRPQFTNARIVRDIARHIADGGR